MKPVTFFLSLLALGCFVTQSHRYRCLRRSEFDVSGAAGPVAMCIVLPYATGSVGEC